MHSPRSGITFLFILCCSFTSLLQAAEVQVSASHGITLSQLDFPDDDVPVLNSSVGLLDVNLIRLRGETGMNTGYLNMLLDGTWSVRNLPVMSDSDYPYSNLSVKFDLGVAAGTEVTSLSAVLILSDTLYQSAPAGTPENFAVGDETIVQGGGTNTQYGAAGNGSATGVPQLAGISFGDPTNNRMVFQLDHPNMEAAKNQCFPMSVANSLQFLENTTQLQLPHSHVAGLKGDQSLVGQIDSTMNRSVTSRTSGSGVPDSDGVKGKLQYLVDNNLHERITTRHWGTVGGSDFSVSNGSKTATSKGQGTAMNFDKLIDALDGGEDCEAAYSFPLANGGFGGHAIDLVAAGYIAGQPFMIESSDIDQSSDTLGAGKSGFLFSFLSPLSTGALSMNNNGQVLDFAMCQKFVPPPQPSGTSLPPATGIFYIPGTELEIIKVTDPAGHSCCAEFPPGSMELAFENGFLILKSLITPWLPMTLNMDAQGNLSGSNTATVAGFSNISNSITGSIDENRIVAEITLGKDGGLPQGQPIIFEVEITPEEPWPWLFEEPDPVLTPAIRINGFRNTHSLQSGEPLSIGVSLQPGTDASAADWWLVAEAEGTYYSFDAATFDWLPGIAPVLVSPAMSLPATTVYTFTDGLPAGEYQFHFGLDPTPDSSLDLDTLVYDSVAVSISPP